MISKGILHPIRNRAVLCIPSYTTLRYYPVSNNIAQLAGLAPGGEEGLVVKIIQWANVMYDKKMNLE